MEIPRPPAWGGGGEFHMALGTYEHDELNWVLKHLTAGDVFIDVGAHVGYFTLPVAKRVGPNGTVIAIEPTPSSVSILRRNVELNAFVWVSVVAAAAADRDGEMALAVDPTSAMWNSLRPQAVSGSTKLRITATKVDTIVSDAGWPPIAGIKVDVEGAEADVLRGAAAVLERNPRAFVLFELQGGGRVERSLETLDLLRGQGYRFFRPGPDGTAASTTPDELMRLMNQPAWQDSLLNVIAQKEIDTAMLERGGSLVRKYYRERPRLTPNDLLSTDGFVGSHGGP